jgi:hypothetical protein
MFMDTAHERLLRLHHLTTEVRDVAHHPHYIIKIHILHLHHHLLRIAIKILSIHTTANIMAIIHLVPFLLVRRLLDNPVSLLLL